MSGQTYTTYHPEKKIQGSILNQLEDSFGSHVTWGEILKHLH